MYKLAILIPCYNEEKSVEKVISEYRNTYPDAQIYVYNNNSTDRTEQIVKRMMGSDSNLFLKNESKQGKGNVVQSMFKDIDADVYLMTDGDCTYPAEDSKQLVECILNNQADMSIGDRLSSTYFTENKRRFHGFGNNLVKFLIKLLFHSNIADIMTGSRAFNKNFVKNIPITSPGFEIETEMTILAIKNNFKISSFPISYRDREEGSVSKLNTYSDGFKVIRTIIKLYFRYLFS